MVKQTIILFIVIFYHGEQYIVPFAILNSLRGAGIAQWWWHSARLPPMWREFDSRTRHYKWVEFVVGSRPCSERFFLRVLRIFPLLKKHFPANFNSIRNPRATGLSVVTDCLSATLVKQSWFTVIEEVSLLISIYFDLQPMFYHLGHFSKFVPPGSQRVKVTSSQNTSLEYIGFVTPQTDTVMVILNTEARNITINITDKERGTITGTIPAYSIQTYIW